MCVTKRAIECQGHTELPEVLVQIQYAVIHSGGIGSKWEKADTRVSGTDQHKKSHISSRCLPRMCGGTHRTNAGNCKHCNTHTHTQIKMNKNRDFFGGGGHLLPFHLFPQGFHGDRGWDRLVAEGPVWLQTRGTLQAEWITHALDDLLERQPAIMQLLHHHHHCRCHQKVWGAPPVN